MNDNFIKDHRQRPDPKFVERLSQTLNSNPTPERSFPMFKRPAFVITLAVILTVILTLAVSPDARAAVQAILTLMVSLLPLTKKPANWS